MPSGKRLKFNGSTLSINTGTTAAKTITAITSANPGVVTATAHAMTQNTVGRIAAVVGMTQLNGGIYIVDTPTANTFNLAGTDNTANSPYVSGGTFTPFVFSQFCELTGIDQQDGTTDEIDVTTICSTAKEFETGLADSGSVTLNYNYAPNEAVQLAFNAAKKAGTPLAIRVTFAGGGTVIMIGLVTQSSFNGAVGAVWTGSTSLKLTGDIFLSAV